MNNSVKVLFCQNTELFCQNTELFCQNTELFCQNTELFCQNTEPSNQELNTLKLKNKFYFTFASYRCGCRIVFSHWWRGPEPS